MFGVDTTVLVLLACLNRDPKDCMAKMIALPSMSLNQCREFSDMTMLQWISSHHGVKIKKWSCKLWQNVKIPA
jgi:hypothetical protein